MILPCLSSPIWATQQLRVALPLKHALNVGALCPAPEPRLCPGPLHLCPGFLSPSPAAMEASRCEDRVGVRWCSRLEVPVAAAGLAHPERHPDACLVLQGGLWVFILFQHQTSLAHCYFGACACAVPSAGMFLTPLVPFHSLLSSQCVLAEGLLQRRITLIVRTARYCFICVFTALPPPHTHTHRAVCPEAGAWLVFTALSRAQRSVGKLVGMQVGQ